MIWSLGKFYFKVDEPVENLAFIATLGEIATLADLHPGFGAVFGAPDPSAHVDTLTDLATSFPDPSAHVDTLTDLATSFPDPSAHVGTLTDLATSFPDPSSVMDMSSGLGDALTDHVTNALDLF